MLINIFEKFFLNSPTDANISYATINQKIHRAYNLRWQFHLRNLNIIYDAKYKYNAHFIRGKISKHHQLSIECTLGKRFAENCVFPRGFSHWGNFHFHIGRVRCVCFRL